MKITLGKDCMVSAGGNVASARNVTLSKTARTIDVHEFGTRLAAVYSTGYEASVSIEFLDSNDAVGLITALDAGTSIQVFGGSGGWSFPAVVTGVGESCPVDGVATFTVEARLTVEALR